MVKFYLSKKGFKEITLEDLELILERAYWHGHNKQTKLLDVVEVKNG